MTTIAATLTRMAADSRVVTGRGGFSSNKLLRTARGIVGAAGEAAHCAAVLLWFDGRRARPPRIGSTAEFQALLLNHAGLFYFEHDMHPNPVHEGHFAIGSGAEVALGAMDRDISLMLPPDPIEAVRIACKRDEHSSEPIAFLTLAHSKTRGARG